MIVKNKTKELVEVIVGGDHVVNLDPGEEAVVADKFKDDVLALGLEVEGESAEVPKRSRRKRK